MPVDVRDDDFVVLAFGEKELVFDVKVGRASAVTSDEVRLARSDDEIVLDDNWFARRSVVKTFTLYDLFPEVDAETLYRHFARLLGATFSRAYTSPRRGRRAAISTDVPDPTSVNWVRFDYSETEDGFLTLHESGVLRAITVLSDFGLAATIDPALDGLPTGWVTLRLSHRRNDDGSFVVERRRRDARVRYALYRAGFYEGEPEQEPEDPWVLGETDLGSASGAA